MKSFLAKQSKKKKAICLVVMALLIAGGSRIFAGTKEAPKEDVIWREYPVTVGDITAALDGGGAIEATGVNHSFDVDLTLEEVVVAVGEEVKKGQVLAYYLKEELKNTLTEAQMNLANAKRNLEEVKTGKAKGDLEKSLATDTEKRTAQEAYEAKKRELEKAVAAAQKKIEKQTSLITELEQQLTTAENSPDGSTQGADYEKQKKELARLEQALKDLEKEDKKVDKSAELNALAGQRTALEQQISTLQKEIDGETDPDRKGELEKQKKALEDEVATVNGKYNAAWDAHGGGADDTKASDLEKQIKGLQDKMKDNSSKESVVKKLKEEIKTAKELLGDAQEEKEEQKTNLSELEENRKEDIETQAKKEGTKEEITKLEGRSYENAVSKAEEEIAKCQKKVAEVESLLKTPVLVAKTDGIVTKVNFNAGEKALAGKAVVVIGDTGEKQVVTQISQEDIGSIALGQKVEMQFVAKPDETLLGTVAEKSLVPTDGGEGVNYRVIIALDEPDEELLQGMTCGAKFILKKVENVLTLSNKAIALEGNKQVVTVLLPDGTHEKREIKTGFSDGRTSEIKEGLQDGDIVVVAG